MLAELGKSPAAVGERITTGDMTALLDGFQNNRRQARTVNRSRCLYRYVHTYEIMPNRRRTYGTVTGSALAYECNNDVPLFATTTTTTTRTTATIAITRPYPWHPECCGVP